MIRLYSTLIALAILGLALYRVFRDVTSRGKPPSQNFSIAQLNSTTRQRLSVRWRSKNILAVPINQVEISNHEPRRGEHIALLQRLSSGDVCSVGLFVFIESQRTHFIFKSLSGRKTSQLETWAMQTNSPITWQIINPRLSSGFHPYVQKCERWMRSARAIQEVKMISTRHELFFSSKEFSSVWPFSPMSSVVIKPDLMRGGWRVSSPKGGWQRVVVVGSQNGLKHKIALRFPVRLEKNSHPRGKQVQQLLNKPLGLPGWD